MTRLKKRILIGSFVTVLLLVAGGLIAISLILDGRWLKDQLVEAARTRFGAELQIDSCEFSPLSGSASLSGVHLKRRKGAASIDAQVESIRIRFSPWALLARKVDIHYLEVNRPQVFAVDVRPASISRHAATLLADWITDRSRPSDRPAPSAGAKSPDVTISHLIIHRGEVDYTWSVGDSEPFTARITDLEYDARNVDSGAIVQMLGKADIRCQIGMGQTASLQKVASRRPKTLTVKGVDLGSLSRYFGPSGSPASIGGIMDMDTRPLEEGGTRFDVTIRGLELAGGPAEVRQRLSRLLERIGEDRDQVRLAFTIHEAVGPDDGLDAVLTLFWRGLWRALLTEQLVEA